MFMLPSSPLIFTVIPHLSFVCVVFGDHATIKFHTEGNDTIISYATALFSTRREFYSKSIEFCDREADQRSAIIDYPFISHVYPIYILEIEMCY